MNMGSAQISVLETFAEDTGRNNETTRIGEKGTSRDRENRPGKPRSTRNMHEADGSEEQRGKKMRPPDAERNGELYYPMDMGVQMPSTFER